MKTSTKFSQFEPLNFILLPQFKYVQYRLVNHPGKLIFHTILYKINRYVLCLSMKRIDIGLSQTFVK